MARDRRRTRPPSPETIQRYREALRLRRAGLHYDQIAQQIGYNDSAAAHKAVQAALRLTLQEPAEDVREMEAQRLDDLQRSYWLQALQGNLDAASMVLRIMERRAKLLGLDSPAAVLAKIRIDLRETMGTELTTIIEGVCTEIGVDPHTPEVEAAVVRMLTAPKAPQQEDEPAVMQPGEEAAG